VPSILRKEISTAWLIPLSLVGLPFLLATVGRLCGVLGAGYLGEALVQSARVYGGLPRFLLGLGPFGLTNTAMDYVFAGVFYSGVVFLILVGARRTVRQVRRP
jgi:hypothetical protein